MYIREYCNSTLLQRGDGETGCSNVCTILCLDVCMYVHDIFMDNFMHDESVYKNLVCMKGFT